MAGRCSCDSPPTSTICNCEQSGNILKVCDSDCGKHQQSSASDEDWDSERDCDYGTNCRHWTEEQWNEYHQRVGESDGFDAPDFPICCVIGLIMPYQAPEEKAGLCLLAIEDYNTKNNVKYEFVKVLKATVRVAAGACFNITFEAKHAADRLQIFEASVWELAGECEVELCRMKPLPQSKDETSSGTVGRSD